MDSRSLSSALTTSKSTNKRYPDLNTERWSLAVLIHRLLFGELDPFLWLLIARDIANPKSQGLQIPQRSRIRGCNNG